MTIVYGLFGVMKIGLVGSGYDMLPLMQVLNRYDHEYHFFVDRAYRPWGDKSLELQEERMDVALKYLDDKVDVIIVPPHLEKKKGGKEEKILPLFETYLLDHAFKYSIVGKLWLLCEQAQMNDETDTLIWEIAKKYTPTENQKNIKKFLQPFAIWKKNVRMWSYFLTTYGRREPMLRKALKYDLRYFSDADVDTLIPMSWGFLFYQKIIRQRINWKKKRFHGLDAVQECFEKLVDSKTANTYSMTLHCTDTPTPLLEEKKWMQVLSRGGEIEVLLKKV